VKRALFILLLSSFILHAQTSFDFLRLQISPRAAALAGTYVSNYDDPNVIFYNPAGLNLLKGENISFSFLKHLVGINAASLTFSKNIKKLGRISSAVQYVNYGSFTRADKFGNTFGTFGAYDFALTIGYSNLLDKNFYYGTNIKIIFSGIDNRKASAIAGDFGLLYFIPQSKWSFGFSILNAGTQLSTFAGKQEKLPLDIKFGISKTLEHLPFTFFVSLSRLNNVKGKFSGIFKTFAFGGEFRMGKSLRLRFGYDNQKRKDEVIGSSPGLAGMSVGIGVKIARYKIDYAISSMGEIGVLHRFGISTSL